MRISRRTALTGALLTGAVTALPAPGARAVQPEPVDGSTLPRFGAACLTAAVVAMAVHDGHAYVLTRGIVPPQLVEIDLATRRVSRTIDVPAGEGGWGITVAAGKIYLGLYPVAEVYCFDPATGTLTRVGTLAGAGESEITGQQYVARISARQAPGRGNTVRLTADPEHLHIFVTSTGDRIDRVAA